MSLNMKLRRHYKLLIGTSILVVGTMMVFGDARIIAYTVDSETYVQDSETIETTSELYDPIDFFDQSEMVHTITIDMDEDDYENMVLTYEETGEKEFYSADVTINGETFENVGIRLKGNSTLKGALGTGMGNDSGERGNHAEIPYLIKLNEFEDGQNYQGYTQFSLRISRDDAYLNEVLAYELLEELGITASRSVFGKVEFNGDTMLYTVTEIITTEFLEMHFGEEEGGYGDLFKAGGPNATMSYKGDDPLSYLSYELKTNENESDGYDLIALFQFIDEATDEEFEAHIDEYIDMDSLIRYVAFCNVIVNLDSFPGNGNNYYLYQDPETEQFTLIPWDLNESFGGFWQQQGENNYEFDLFFEEGEGNANRSILNEKGWFDQFNDWFGVDIADAQEIMPSLPPLGPNGKKPPLDQVKGEKPPLGLNGEVPIPEGGMPMGPNGPGNMSMFGQSPLLDRILSIESFREQYIAEVESLVNDEIPELLERVDELYKMISAANEELDFLDETGQEELMKSAQVSNDFLTKRIENLQTQLKEI